MGYEKTETKNSTQRLTKKELIEMLNELDDESVISVRFKESETDGKK